jgi:hypothetical protein
MDALYDESSCGAVSLIPRSFTDPVTDAVIGYAWWDCNDEQAVGSSFAAGKGVAPASVIVNDDTKAEFRELLMFLLQTTCGGWLRKNDDV